MTVPLARAGTTTPRPPHGSATTTARRGPARPRTRRHDYGRSFHHRHDATTEMSTPEEARREFEQTVADADRYGYPIEWHIGNVLQESVSS